MKVVLLHNVPKIGKKYEIKNVSDGHALNFLIPNGLAEVATKASEKRAKDATQAIEVDLKIQADLLIKNLKSLDGAKVTITGKASDKGHLFAGVHKETLVKLLKEQAKVDVSAEFINLEHPLKTVGEHSVPVLVGDKKAEFTVVIEAEK